VTLLGVHHTGLVVSAVAEHLANRPLEARAG
jgi:hypothetical protein